MIKISNKKKPKKVILKYLEVNSNNFIPPLSGRVNLDLFSKKINKYARQSWIFDGDEIVGFMACYVNDPENETAYITTISIVKKYKGQGLGKMLLNDCVDFAKNNGFNKVKLEVSKINTAAILFYEKQGFAIVDCSFLSFFMVKNI